MSRSVAVLAGLAVVLLAAVWWLARADGQEPGGAGSVPGAGGMRSATPDAVAVDETMARPRTGNAAGRTAIDSADVRSLPAAELPGGAERPGATCVRGSVLRPGGEAVANAQVWLIDPSGELELDATVAGALGEFAFWFEVDDPFRGGWVSAFDPRHGVATRRRAPAPTYDGTPTVDVTLDNPLIGIRGAVRGPGGEPIPHYRVQVESVDEAVDFTVPHWRAGAIEGEAWTDDEGRFAIFGLRPGQYRLDYDVDGEELGFLLDDAPYLVTEVRAGDGPIVLDVPYVRLDVRVVDVRGRTLPGGRAWGRFWSARHADAVARVAESGQPLDDLPFDAVGSFETEGASERLWVAPGAIAVFDVIADGRTPRSQVFEVVRDAAVQRLDAIVAPAEMRSGIRVRVLDPDGDAISTSLVQVVSMAFGDPVPIRAVKSYSNQWWELPRSGRIPLPVGRYTLRVRPEVAVVGERYLRDTRYARAERAIEVGSESMEEVEVRAQPGAVVSLRVRSDAVTDAAAVERAVRGVHWDGTPLLRVQIDFRRGENGAWSRGWLWSSAKQQPVTGLPHEPGSTDSLVLDRAFEPGPIDLRLWSTDAGIATEDAIVWDGVELRPGRHELRVRVDGTGMLHRGD